MTNPGTDLVQASRRPKRLRQVVIGGLILSLLGCTGADDDPPPRPALSWPDGEPAGDLESNEWVHAARESDFARAWAHNVADFSLPAVTSTWRGFDIRSFASQVEASLLHGNARVYLGPRPMTPVLVEVDGDGEHAMVAACIGGYEMEPSYDDGNTWPKVAYYLLEVSEDGQRRRSGGHYPEEPLLLPDGAELTDEYCKTVEIPRAVFDPPPDLGALKGKDEGDVVVPTYEPTP